MAVLVETSLGPLFVETVGSGPPVVLWHSLLCDGGMWAGQVRGLADRYQFVNVDAPGHGRSGARLDPFTLDDCTDVALRVLDALELDRVAWCGLSWGGMVGMRLALRAPERLAALVLMDTSARRERLLKRRFYAVLTTIARRLGPVEALARMVAPIFFSPRTRRERPELVEHFVETLVHMDPVTVDEAVRAVVIDRDEVLGHLGNIRVPTLVLVGSEDRATPAHESERIAAGIADARLVRVPDAGHLSALEAPDPVNRELDVFLSPLRSDGEGWAT